MLEVQKYSAVERLRDGRLITIRALRPDDRNELVAAVERIGAQSLYLRFFGVKRQFSDREVGYFVDLDFTDHVALIAVLEGETRSTIIAGGRYITVSPGIAELAFMVADEYQGQGIGPILMRHLAEIARAAGIKELVADVLAANRPMLRVFESTGLRSSARREAELIHVSLQIS